MTTANLTRDEERRPGLCDHCRLYDDSLVKVEDRAGTHYICGVCVPGWHAESLVWQRKPNAPTRYVPAEDFADDDHEDDLYGFEIE